MKIFPYNIVYYRNTAVLQFSSTLLHDNNIINVPRKQGIK